MKLLNNSQLETTLHEPIQIISAGNYNKDAGPDFVNARVKIGETQWVGNVEIHIKASEWNLHHHQTDTAYDNVILHVVYENDSNIFRKDGSLIPCVQIKNHFDENIFETYQSLIRSPEGIPCQNHIKKIDSITMSQWLHRLMVDRLEQKVQLITQSLLENGNNWEDTFYQYLAQSFGAKVNAEPFRLLARSLPVKILAKHKNNLIQVEALVFGTAGFLSEKFTEEYPNQLKKEFDFLKKKYGLKPLKKHLWKFLRLRPANFPTVRLAQFAQLIFQSNHLFSKIIEESNEKVIGSFFETAPSLYWLNHYRFEKISLIKKKHFGQDSIDLLLINTVIPFLFLYGKYKDEDVFMNRSLKLLELVAAEKNRVTESWKQIGISVLSAFDSQALLHLRNNYCNNFRCLECAVGNKILSKNDFSLTSSENSSNHLV
ncbi:MAG: DUF2851 family protein [Chitinophagales bacterium]|nr:DUF2851 family protein [Chitinophagales bacterium]